MSLPLPVALAATSLLLLAGCAASPRPYAPVDQLRYSAIGEAPFWTLAIGDDVILLTLGDEAGGLRPEAWPRTLPRTVDGITRWASGGGTRVISVGARPHPCTGSSRLTYRDQVVVRLSGRELRGCGGPILKERG